MEFFLNQNRQFYLEHLSQKLAEIYEVDADDAKMITEPHLIQERSSRDKVENRNTGTSSLANSDMFKKSVGPKVDCRCKARTWNKGYGARCSKKAKNGSDFCLCHGMIRHLKLCSRCTKKKSRGQEECVHVYHKYAWECMGRYDDPIPTHLFTKLK